MPPAVELASDLETRAQTDEDVPPDLWERLWEEWVPFDPGGD